MSKSSSTPSSFTFEESDQNGDQMKNIFENLKDVPDKDTPARKTALKTSSKKSRPSTRDLHKRPDDEIDLHGKTRDEAIRIVQKFVIDCYQKNFRSALIITGKGNHSTEKTPVLKREVNLWLERNGDSYITNFGEAPPRYGGSGAIWLNFK